MTGRQTTAPTPRDAGAQVGWEYVHVCVDDATRLAYVEVLADEKATTAIGFLRRALAFYAAHGIRSAGDDRQRLGLPLALHALACRALGIAPPTRPYRPRTNGKAERFIRTMLADWAYGAIYASPPNAPPRSPAGSTLQLPTTTRRPQPPTAGQPASRS